jgi:hypothetical protein
MNKDEVIKLIKRNKNTKQEAIVLISDFLDISKSEAVKIYREEFEDNE